MDDHYIICGMGTVGYRCVRLLCRLGERVTVVTRETRTEWRREAESCGVRIVTGDVRDEGLLVRAGIGGARALIAATDNDIANIEVLLDARRIRPDLPVVVRIFDQTLAQQMETGFDVRRALGTSALAAPVFAAAALGEQVLGTFAAGDDVYVIGSPTLDNGSPLCGCTVAEIRRRFGFTALTHGAAGGDEVTAPNPDTLLRIGDRVTVVGPRAAWRSVEADDEAGASARARSRLPRWLRPWAWGRAIRDAGGAMASHWREVPYTLRALLVVFSGLIALSFFMFRIGLGLSALDALYYTVSTLVASDLGDISMRETAPLLKLYGALVMILGSVTVAVLYAILTDMIVTARFQQVLGRQRIPRRGHVIVAGLGNVGYRIVGELRRSGIEVAGVDVDADSPFLDSLRTRTPIVIGDARLRHTLEKAGADHARAVIAASHDDAVNLAIALAAKQLNPRARTVVRLFDAAFAEKVEASLNVDRAISASRRAAPTFVAAALYAGVRKAFELDGRLFTVLQREAGTEWQGRTPADLRAAGDAMILRRSGTLGEDAPLDSRESILAVTWRDIRT